MNSPAQIRCFSFPQVSQFQSDPNGILPTDKAGAPEIFAGADSSVFEFVTKGWFDFDAVRIVVLFELEIGRREALLRHFGMRM